MMNLFLLGRPGGGKSTVVSMIRDYVKDVIPVVHGDDYPILFQMYQEDREGIYFTPSVLTDPDLGFNIIDPENSPVFDLALTRLELEAKKRQQRNREEGREEIIIFELARREYKKALGVFSSEFLRQSRFMLIEASIPTSIERIRKRAESHEGHYISGEIIEGYYGVDNYPLLDGHTIEGQPVVCIWNEEMTKDQLRGLIHTYVDETLMPHFGIEGGKFTTGPER